MTENSDRDSSPITFQQELARKATHMGALVIPGGYHLLGLARWEMFWIMFAAFSLMVLIEISRLRRWKFWTEFAVKIIGPMVRKHEQDGDFTGATYILLSVCCTIALFEKPLAIAALSFIIVGDSFAAVIGRRFGRHRFGRKSFEGSLACLFGTVLVAFLVPGVPLFVGLFGAFVATVVEALSITIDDNISVPILSGLAMTLLIKIFDIQFIF